MWPSALTPSFCTSPSCPVPSPLPLPSPPFLPFPLPLPLPLHSPPHSSNRDSGKQRLITETIAFLRSLGPFWDAKGGADHIFLVSEEYGKCALQLYGLEDPRLASTITLTPWGFLQNASMVRQAGGLPGLVREGGADGEGEVQQQGQQQGQEQEGQQQQQQEDSGGLGQGGRERQYLLFVRGLNVSDGGSGWDEEAHQQKQGEQQQRDNKEHGGQQQRDIKEQQQVQAGGKEQGEPPFSFGVRQRVFELYAGRDGETGFKVEVAPEGGEELAYGGMEHSVFCLATAGHGWHASLAMAVIAGCVPVVIQPEVLLPFEGDGVDWTLVSYRLNIRDIPQLHERLQAIPPEDIELKQKRLRQLWPLFIWSAPQFNPVDFLPESAQMQVSKIHSPLFRSFLQLRVLLEMAGLLSSSMQGALLKVPAAAPISAPPTRTLTPVVAHNGAFPSRRQAAASRRPLSMPLRASELTAIDTFTSELEELEGMVDGEYEEVPVHTVTVHDRERGVTYTVDVPQVRFDDA
ncbi:unnamed protein product [Closterium sp. NIES-54]